MSMSDLNDRVAKHSDLFMKGLATGLKTSEEFQKLDENATKLERLSGYSLDNLIEMLASGWTLEPPKKSCTVSELMKEFEQGGKGMSKIKLFSHCDLDGVGCAILAYLAFGRENVDVEYCNYRDVDEKVFDFCLNGLDKGYDAVYITDISISNSVAEKINYDTETDKWRLFDHHATALVLNTYEWCEVQIDNTLFGIKTSGTELFAMHLFNIEQFDHYGAYVIGRIQRFAEIVRDYDTWRWKELDEEGLVCKQVNDLLYIYGRDEFIDWTIEQITGECIPIRPLSKFPSFTEKDLALLDQKQKDIDIYVAEKEKQMKISHDVFGYSFGWVFAERYFSELGNRLCEMHPEIEYMAMIDISKGTVSFRSVKDDIDLGGEIAHSLGGGGHKKAAGSRFNAGEIGKFVSWSVLNVKPAWSDIMPQYLGEPVKKEDLIMSKCSKCPYTTEVTRKFGVTKHCNLERTHMDVTYYCSPKHSDEKNMLCPLVNEYTRFPGVNYRKYETDEID